MCNITLERASELVKNASSSEDRADLFAHFDNYLNPQSNSTYPPIAELALKWRKMFAEMCGYVLVEPIETL